MRRVGTRETPGRAAAAARRRSGKGLGRETPRDILRGLSRSEYLLASRTGVVYGCVLRGVADWFLVLPPTALVASSSPRVPLPSIEGPKARFGRHEDNFVQEQELQPPRLSLPLEEMLENDEDEPLPRPRLSILDDDTTQRSIELPRRAQSELLSDRFSRDSFGIRLSGRFDDLTGLDEDDELEEELDIQRPVFEDYELADETGLPRLDESVPELDADDSISVEGQRDAMDVPDLDEDVLEDDVGDEEPALATEKMKRRPKTAPKLSRHGLPIPNLPSSMIKKVATRALASRARARALADKEVMKAVLEATEMFFEQVSDDLGSYAQHAKRKTIDESDLVTLMRRQRQLGGAVTPFSLAQRYLPRELLQELRMPVLPKARVGKGRQQALESLNGEENS